MAARRRLYIFFGIGLLAVAAVAFIALTPPCDQRRTDPEVVGPRN